MTLPDPKDPHSGAPLALVTVGKFSSWVSPTGSGVAVTLSQLHDYVQDDEIDRLWQAARNKYRSNQVSSLSSPTGDRKMVQVVVALDHDEDDTVAPGSPTITVDVDFEDQVIWFDAGELERFAADLPNPEEREWTPEETAAIHRSARDLADAWGRSVKEQEDQNVLGSADNIRRIEDQIAANYGPGSLIHTIARHLFS